MRMAIGAVHCDNGIVAEYCEILSSELECNTAVYLSAGTNAKAASMYFSAASREFLLPACGQQPARLQAASQPAPPGAASGHRLPEDAAPRRVTCVLF
jgi:hypothetical protein